MKMCVPVRNKEIYKGIKQEMQGKMKKKRRKIETKKEK
jgi:hypothetical protein